MPQTAYKSISTLHRFCCARLCNFLQGCKVAESFEAAHERFAIIGQTRADICYYSGGQVTINVPTEDFIIPIIDQATRQPVLYNGSATDTTCAFQILPRDDVDYWTMGFPILRSMYIVFDMDNGQVSIAQAANTTGSSDIVTVAKGSGGLASAVPNVLTVASNSWYVPQMASTPTQTYSLADAAAAIGTATGIAAVPVEAQVSSSAISATVIPPTAIVTVSPTSWSKSGGGTNVGAIAGGVVGGVVGLALIVGAIIFFLKRRKSNARRKSQMREVQTSWAGTGSERREEKSPAIL